MNTDNSTEEVQQNLLNIGFAISQSNFNIRSYKKQHVSRHIKVHSDHKPLVSKLKTQPGKNSQTSFKDIRKNAQKSVEVLNKSLKYNHTFIQPVISNKQTQSQQNIQNKTLFKFSENRYRTNFLNRSKKIEYEEQDTQLEQYETAWGKGKMKDKSIEEWLNAICMQYMSNQQFDKKIHNCALKKLDIDKNSLLENGIKPDHIPRLYNSFFVFGMGWNELVKELTNGDPKLLKSIWKVYSLVSEYCSKGDLKTSMGELEKDFTKKIVELTAQLQQKQYIIDNNDELNLKKNNEIYTEVVKLRQQKINLINEKSALYSSFKSTEQAFNEEAELRLTFQTKINEMYCLYKELSLKHQHLFDEMGIKMEDVRNYSEKYFDVADRISQYKEVQNLLREQLSLYKQKAKRHSFFLEESNKEVINLTGKLAKTQFDLKMLRNLYQQIKLKEKQWEIEKANMEVIVDLREKSTRETFNEYQLTLEENNKLYLQVSEQRKVIDQQEKQKRNFNTRVISIVSENSYNKRKYEELKKQHQKLQRQYELLTDEKEEVQQKIEVYVSNEESLKEYFNIVQGNMDEMHKISMTQHEELYYLRNFHETINNIMNQKNENILKLTEEKTKLKDKLEEMKVRYEQLQSKHSVTLELSELIQKTLDKRTMKLDGLEESFEQKYTQMSKTIKQLGEQLDTTKASLQKILQDYKNQKFQRNALNNAYMHSLKILESKNEEERNLNVRISFMEGDLTKHKENYLILEKNMFRFIDQCGKIQEDLEEIISAQRDKIYEKIQYCHPMIVEDLAIKVNFLTDEREKLEIKSENLQNVLFRERQNNRQAVERTATSHKWEISKLTKQKDKIIQTLTNQISFLKEQNSIKQEKLSQLEDLAETYRKKIYEKSTSEREQIYKFMVEEKKKEIENMMAEMEKLQDQLFLSKRLLAQSTFSHKDEIYTASVELRKSFEESIRKEVAHEYEIKNKEMQKNLREQYNRKEQLRKEQAEKSIQGMSIEDIMKIKKVKPEQMISQISSSLGMSFEITQRTLNREQIKKNETRKKREDIEKRRQLGRLLKNAYQYYDS